MSRTYTTEEVLELIGRDDPTQGIAAWHANLIRNQMRAEMRQVLKLDELRALEDLTWADM